MLEVLGAMYGSKFTDAWRGTEPLVLVRVWAAGMKGYRPSEVERGLAACMKLKWPPTLPEFLTLCRPALDPEGAYLEACEQMRKREAREDVWSNAAIYWAAATMSFELRTLPYAAVKARWARELDKAVEGVAAGRLPADVPAAALAITDDRKATPMPAHVRAQLDGLVRRMTTPAPAGNGEDDATND